MTSNARTARCGPACRVVGQGRLRKSRSPYADSGYGFHFLGLSGWHAALRVVLGMLAYGAGIEVPQWAVGWRFAEWADVAADAVGVVLAWVCVAGLRRRV